VAYTRSILFLVAGLGLAFGRLPAYVDLAKCVVVLSFPIFSLFLILIVPYMLVGRLYFTPDVIIGMLAQIFVAAIIVAYLSLSKRVKATYSGALARQKYTKATKHVSS
jgi:hypothetical protein